MAKRKTAAGKLVFAEKGADDPLWYKDAIIYELHVRAFFDSDGDGIGDFKGLTGKLDYIHDLGVTAVWLLPFYPSPLKDDGYDIADYQDVHPDYGTLRDFKIFLREAHNRGLKVITELVVNHTSSQHPWFQRARRAPAGSPWRDFYVWSDNPERYREARVIFKDFETSNWSWDPVAKAYYWHRFYSHQPDLNFANPRVQRAVLQTMDFWLGMGVDGLRLDAVPYLFEREGTNCENLPETHAFLKKLRRHVDSHHKNRMLLAEANQWPEDAVTYFGEGDECHMAFHFPVMPRMFMALQLEDRFPVIDILEQTPSIPDGAQWALFLRNHDELTLEMVTDEDRDYMYRVYATDPQARINLGIRRRLAPLLANRRKIELMNALLFSMPGTPVVYYADEIGMGDNIFLGDRNGVRTPMQWSSDRNAGFSRTNPQRLYLPVIIDPEYHFEAVNVEAQQANLHSVLWWMKRLIALRKQYKAFGRGSIEFLHPENPKVLTFVRSYENERILVVANLSRFVQCVELDMAEYKGVVPVELFGRTEFPPIGELPYFLTLGPHSFYWFVLEPARVEGEPKPAGEVEPAAITVSGSWNGLVVGKESALLERILPEYLRARRWFGGKARQIKGVRIRDAVPMTFDSRTAYFAIVDVDYRQDPTETYLLSIAFAAGTRAAEMRRGFPRAVIAEITVKRNGEPQQGVLYDALIDRDFCLSLLHAMQRRRRFRGKAGVLEASSTRLFRSLLGSPDADIEPRISQAEQSNSSVVFGDRMILKAFRRGHEGTNPDLEVSRFLTERHRFAGSPPLAGALEYRRGRREPITVAMMQGFVPNQGDAWRVTLDALGRYFERAIVEAARQPQPLSLPHATFEDIGTTELPELASEVIGAYLSTAELLGLRTAEMHVALASESEPQELAPEAFSTLYQRSLYQTIRARSSQSLDLLRRRLRTVPEGLRTDAAAVLALEPQIYRRLKALTDHRIQALRTRCHGDYHLGQVLATGSDFVIIDFEGEPARSIGERRIKRSPLRDVAGMLRSFHYAAESALAAPGIRGEDLRALEPWAKFWHEWVSVQFLRSYLKVASKGSFLPPAASDVAILLDVFLLEKATYELEYELNNRPDWVRIPIRSLLQLLQPGD